HGAVFIQVRDAARHRQTPTSRTPSVPAATTDGGVAATERYRSTLRCGVGGSQPNSPVQPHGESIGDARSNRTWNVCCRQDAGGTRNNSPIYVGDRIRLTNAVTVEGRHQLSPRRRQAIGDRVECQTRKTAFPSRNPLALTG